MATTEVVSQIDSNAIINYLAQGNPFIWVLLVILIFVAFIAAWIYFEPKIRSLFLFFGDLFSKDEKIEKEKEKNALAIKANLFLNKIYTVLSKTDALTLSNDVGRNHFYHYMVSTSLSILLDKLKDLFNEYQTGKIPDELFCSYHKLHSLKVIEAREEFKRIVGQKLKEEGWNEETVNYVIQKYIQWMNNHSRLLSELISSSSFPTEVIMSWWVFYYEVYMNLDEFGIILNGRITGQCFEKLKIGKPDKRATHYANVEEKL